MSEVIFKKPRKFRRRETEVPDEDNEEEDSLNEVLEETKELQKLRKRPNGVSIEDLAVIKNKPKEQSATKDPLKLKKGGFVDVKTLKREDYLKPLAKKWSVTESQKLKDIEQIGTSFALETNRRDEDADMIKYVEEEMAKKKGIKSAEETIEDKPKNPEDALYEIPESINFQTSRKKTEDMMSTKCCQEFQKSTLIRNIEATEEAKQRLMEERLGRRDKVSDFVPTNVAVNFVQHNRFNIEDTNAHVRKVVQTPKPTPLRVGDADRPRTVQEDQAQPSRPIEKATDDYHFDKFKKYVRRF